VVSCAERWLIARFQRFVAGMPARIVKSVVVGGATRGMMYSEKAMQTFTADHRRSEEAQNAPRYSGSKVPHAQNHRNRVHGGPINYNFHQFLHDCQAL